MCVIEEAKEAEAAASGNAYYAPQDPHNVYMPQQYPAQAPPPQPDPGTAPPPSYNEATKKTQWMHSWIQQLSSAIRVHTNKLSVNVSSS